MSSFSPLGHTFEAYRPGSGMTLAALLAGAALVGTEFVLPRLQRYPDGIIAEEDTSDILGFGGLKHANADFMKKHIEPITGPMTSINYPSHGLDIDSMSAQLGAYVAKLPRDGTMAVVGQSLGLLTSIKTLGACVRSGFAVPKIDTVWGVSSPMDALDIVHSKRYKVLPTIATHMRSTILGIAGDVLTEVVPAQDHVKAGRTVLRRRAREYRGTQNAEQWGTMFGLAYTDTNNELDALAESGVIGPHTTVKLFYQREDKVVHAEQAAERLSTKLATLGVATRVVMEEGTSHANMDTVPKHFWHRENKVYSTN